MALNIYQQFFIKTKKKIAEKYINILKEKGFDVATTLREFKNFYEAEDYHQDYYSKKGSTPYCHFYNKIFLSKYNKIILTNKIILL